jgi:hypothetical protein
MSTCIDPLPDFTKLSYTIVSPPIPAKGRGWDKVKECERCLVKYTWAERRSMPQGPQHDLPLPYDRQFLSDCLNDFLMALEAAFQFVSNQLHVCGKLHKSKFNAWLRNLPEHDLQIRGLRTLRHLNAHVEIYPAGRGIIVNIEKAVEISPKYWLATEQTLLHQWLLPILNLNDLTKLTSPELTPADLPDWDMLRSTDDAAKILEHGLRRAQEILLEAEKLL